MKKTIFRLSALVLALVMLLAALGGCNNPNGTVNKEGNGEKTDYTNHIDNSTVAEAIQITTTVYEIAKHGNLILNISGAELFGKGFDYGDIAAVTVAEQTWEVPLCTNYSDVDNGVTVLRLSLIRI